MYLLLSKYVGECIINDNGCIIWMRLMVVNGLVNGIELVFSICCVKFVYDNSICCLYIIVM